VSDDVPANLDFLDGVDRWMGVLGRLRDVVRQQVLSHQLRELLQGLPAPQRTLDVGCGQGTQALTLARAGHQVTGLDISEQLLELFASQLRSETLAVQSRVQLILGPGEEAPNLAPGPYDLILCHGVLMYLDDLSPMCRALTAVASETGTLSLLVRNGYAPAMRAGLRGNGDEALNAFDSAEYVNRLGLAARAHTPEELDAQLLPLGWQRHSWQGIRVFTDHRDEPAPEPAELGSLLAAEIEAGRRDPYRAVAALLHVTYVRASPGEARA
jgi:S-adenosylmethionine-dependent methyltransferase